MLLQSIRPQIIIKQEEQERIRNGFPRVLQNSGVECGESAFFIVNLLEGIKNTFVFAFVGCGGGFSKLSLDLQTGYDEVEGVDG